MHPGVVHQTGAKAFQHRAGDIDMHANTSGSTLRFLARPLACLLLSGLTVGLLSGQALAAPQLPAPQPAAPTLAAAQSAALAPPAPEGSSALPYETKTSIPGDAYWGGLPGQATPPPVPPSSLQQAIDASTQGPQAGNGVSWARAQAITSAAKAYGVQAGLASEGFQIDQTLQQNASQYDRVFDFSAVMLSPGFLPPVIVEGRDAYHQPSPTTARAADRLYKIMFPAKIVSTPPTWRDYLPVAYKAPTPPSAAVRPKSSAEKKLWDSQVAVGWDQGVRLADETFAANVGRLRRDFDGMLRYKALYQQGVVKKPLLASEHLGVTGGGDEMAINDRVYQVTRNAALDPNTQRWSTQVPQTVPADAAPQPQMAPVPPARPQQPAAH